LVDKIVEEEPAEVPADDEPLDPQDNPEGDTGDFDSAFDEMAVADAPADNGGDPEPAPAAIAATDTPAATGAVEAAVAAKETPEPSVDIWAEASDAQRAAFQAANADAHRWKSDQGRAVHDRARIAELEGRVAPKSGAADAAPQEGAIAQILEGDAWKTVEKELPELAGPLREIVSAVSTENAALKRELGTFSNERRAEVSLAQVDIVHTAHSDWDAVTDDPAFVTWARNQPAFVQEMLGRNAEKIVDGHEAAHVVSLYKQSEGFKPPGTPVPVPVTPAASEPRAAQPIHAVAPAAAPSKHDRAQKRRIAANTSVPSTGPGAQSGAPDEFDAAFEHYAATG